MPLVDPISMSSTSAQSPAGQSSESKPKYLIHPAPVADSPIAKGIAFSRPAVLLGLLATGLSWLIAEPSSALQVSVPVVSAIQLAYAVLSLPVAGSQLGKARKTQKKKESGGNPVSTAILSLILTAISTPVVYVFFVLFGAPFLDNTLNTILCAFHFSLLGLFPVFFVRGLDNEALVAVAGAAAPIDETFGALGGAILGAWLGAIPIPLDWDRDWQKWPVTIVIGMYLGSCLGSLIGGTILYGKRLGSDSTAPTSKDTKEE